MSRIDSIKERMKQKISAGDPLGLQSSKKKARKLYSLTAEDNSRLYEIYSNRLRIEGSCSIPNLMSEAIQLLYLEEFDALDPT